MYILSFLAGSFALWLLSFLVLAPEGQSFPGQEPAKYNFEEQTFKLHKDGKGRTFLQIEKLISSINNSDSQVETDRLKEIHEEMRKRPFFHRALNLYDSLSPISYLKDSVALEKYQTSMDKYNKRKSAEKLWESSMTASLLIPYALFLFIRTIIWSVRQVRRGRTAR